MPRFREYERVEFGGPSALKALIEAEATREGVPVAEWVRTQVVTALVSRKKMSEKQARELGLLR